MSKRADVMKAARSAFGRDGYARASIDGIARDASVSTRTLYNHFPGKEALFTAVIQESANYVAEQLSSAADDHSSDVQNLTLALTKLAKSWFDIRSNNKDHFAIVRQAMAEAPHFPPKLIESWIAAGPAVSTRVLAGRMKSLMDAGYLRRADPGRTANHFIMLTIGELSRESFGDTLPLSEAQIDATVVAGIDIFLHGYTRQSE